MATGADLQDPLASVTGEPAGDVPDPVAERVRLGFPQVLDVVEPEACGNP
jgi:hypothetical protein